MELSKTVRVTLTNEDVKKAIAEYASASFAGDYVFDARAVRITGENEHDEIEVEAVVSSSF